MKRFLILMLFIGMLTTYSCLESSSSVIEVVSAEEMKELTALEDIQVVDVRTPQEYSQGYIPNAQNIDYLSPDFELQIQQLDKTKPIVVYCKSGGRSSKCAEKLEDAGFVKIYDFQGGVAKWKYKDYDLTDSDSKP